MWVLYNNSLCTDGLPPASHNYSSKSRCHFFQVILPGIVLSCDVVCLVFNIVFRNRKLVKKIVKNLCHLSTIIAIDQIIVIFIHRIVKLTSPCLNYVHIVGGVMCLAIGLVTVPSTQPLLSYFGCEVSNKCMCISKQAVSANSTYLSCMYIYTNLYFLQVTRIFSAIGYDIVLAIPLLKTFRVYYIFKNPFPNKKVKLQYYIE